MDGKQAAITYFSRSWDDVDDSILGRMAQQLWVTSGELKGMYSCTHNLDWYLAHLRAGGHLA